MESKIVRIALSEVLRNFEELIISDESNTLYEITFATGEEFEKLYKKLEMSFDEIIPLKSYGIIHNYLEIFCIKNERVVMYFSFDLVNLNSDICEFIEKL